MSERIDELFEVLAVAASAKNNHSQGDGISVLRSTKYTENIFRHRPIESQ